jgi:hypothetical protein
MNPHSRRFRVVPRLYARIRLEQKIVWSDF